RRALSDANGDVRSVWDDTRLEAMRYVTMVPGREFDLLSGPARQIKLAAGHHRHVPHRFQPCVIPDGTNIAVCVRQRASTGRINQLPLVNIIQISRNTLS